MHSICGSSATTWAASLPRRLETGGAALPQPSRLDAVLYLRPDEVDRFALLRETIERFGAPIGTLWVATADVDFAAVSAVVAGPGVVVVPESELVPEAVGRPDAPLGVRRQIAKLALVERTNGDFCFDLSADVICVRPFPVAALIRGGKAVVSRRINEVHADRYERAEEVLGLKRSGWVHGSLPYLLSKPGVAKLREFLDDRSAASSVQGGSWRTYLLDRPGWVLGCVYFTYLEAFGLDECYYFPSDANVYGNCVWSADDWDRLAPGGLVRGGVRVLFLGGAGRPGRDCRSGAPAHAPLSRTQPTSDLTRVTGRRMIPTHFHSCRSPGPNQRGSCRQVRTGPG